jgi:biopolymer transport protein ExbB
MFHRYFVNRVENLTIGMEEQALRLIEVMMGEREPSPIVARGVVA